MENNTKPIVKQKKNKVDLVESTLVDLLTFD